MPADVKQDERDYNRTHPDYDARAMARQFNEDHYSGGRALVESGAGYLSQWKMESPEAFAARKARAGGLYENLIQRTLIVYQSQLFRVSPERNLPPAIEPMIDDVDMYGTSAGDFFRQVSEWAHIHDLCGVLVDSPRVPPGATEAQVIEARLRPYFEMVKATQIIDWEIEQRDSSRKGRFNYVVIRSEHWIGQGVFMPRRRITRYRVWTRDEWAVFEGGNAAEVVPVDAGPNPLGEVPLVVLYETRLGPMRGRTLIDDVALRANALWNAASQRDEAYHYQSFNILAVFSDDRTLAELKIGESRALRLASSDKAEFLVPSGIPFDAYDQIRKECQEAVADLVFARTAKQTPTAQVESAEKRELDREEFVALLKAKAGALEVLETECFKLAAALRGVSQSVDGTQPAVEVRYPKEFRIDGTPADQWAMLVQYGIKSREEWHLATHPGVSSDDAAIAVAENLAHEREIAASAAPTLDPSVWTMPPPDHAMQPPDAQPLDASVQ